MATVNHIRIELEEISPALAAMPATNPFTVPAGYFDTLAQQVMMNIKTADSADAVEEIAVLSPLLSGLKQKNTFSMPAGYFEQLNANTLQSVKEPVKGKLVPMFGRNSFKYAAAAAVVGILAVGAWFFTGSKNESGDLVAQTNEVVTEKQMQLQVNAVSDSEMINYLDSNLTSNTIDAVNESADINKDDLKLLLADISDKELEQYINSDAPRAEKFN